MTIRVYRNDVLSHVNQDLRADADKAAGSNHILSKTEQAKMEEGLLKKAAGWVREDGGPGTRVEVDAVVNKATKWVAKLLKRVNQPSGAGADRISQKEVRELAKLDQEVGVRVARAYELITGKHIDLTPPTDLTSLSSASVLSVLEPSLGTMSPRVRGEIEIFNESGDNGVNTFGTALPGATDLQDAIAKAKAAWGPSWNFPGWDMEVQVATAAKAIEGYLAAARDLYAQEPVEPAEVKPIIDAFAERVQQTFGSLAEVRLVTGTSVDGHDGGTYLFGKTTDGWVSLAVRQYRDG